MRISYTYKNVSQNIVKVPTRKSECSEYFDEYLAKYFKNTRSPEKK